MKLERRDSAFACSFVETSLYCDVCRADSSSGTTLTILHILVMDEWLWMTSLSNLDPPPRPLPPTSQRQQTMSQPSMHIYTLYDKPGRAFYAIMRVFVSSQVNDLLSALGIQYGCLLGGHLA
jgi:hypothetical protein